MSTETFMRLTRFRVHHFVVAIATSFVLSTAAIAADVTSNGSHGAAGPNGVDGAPPTDGGPGLSGGNATANAAGASGTTNNANANGGAGGSGGSGGNATAPGFAGGDGGIGGQGGNATATSTTNRSSTVDASATSNAYGGGGGNGGGGGVGFDIADPNGINGAGGRGGDASTVANATGQSADVQSFAWGGWGGSERVGGDGGNATAQGSATATGAGFNAGVYADGRGGFGGAGNAGAGGNGGNVTANNAVTGNTNAGTLNLTQRAFGGDGGSASTIALDGVTLNSGGNGGDAISTLSNANVHAGGTSTGVSLDAYGGNGGGGGIGGNGGDATIGFTLTDDGDINVGYNVWAGNGGQSQSDGIGGPVGAAGMAGITTLSPSSVTSTGGGTLFATGILTGGAGGGTDNGVAQAGADVSITQTPTLSTTGSAYNSLTVTGGFGGAGDTVNGGDGGDASIVTDQIVSMSFYSDQVNAFGAKGGSTNSGVGTFGGNGGSAEINSEIINEIGDVNASGSAYGGDGGDAYGIGNHSGTGGDAFSSVVAETSAFFSTATSNATAWGGNGGFLTDENAMPATGGNATALSSAFGSTASAWSDAQAGQSSSTNVAGVVPVADGVAIAQSEASGSNVNAYAQATGRNAAATSTARGETGLAQSYVDSDVNGIASTSAVRVQSYVFANAGTSLGNAVVVHAEVVNQTTGLGTPSETVSETGRILFDLTPELFSAPMFGPLSGFSSDPSGLGLDNPLGLTGTIAASNDANVVLEQSVSFTSTIFLSPENFGGGNLTDAELVFGFHDVFFAGNGFDELALSLDYNGSQSWAFGSSGDFMDFVNDGPILLGLFTSNLPNQAVTFNMTWTSDNANDAFSSSFYLGTVAAIPEPSSIAALAFMGVVGVLARRRAGLRSKRSSAPETAA
jgi:hypothetical protein